MAGTAELQILLVEDQPDDVALLERALGRARQFRGNLTHVDTIAAALELLPRHFDVVLLDLSLPDQRGEGSIETVQRVLEVSPETPIVVTTGLPDDEVAIAAVRAGAQDYLRKDYLTAPLLERAILYAIERHRLLEQLRSLSLHDDLTGLHNRRGFLAAAEQARRSAVRHGSSMLLFFIDLDGLKVINDALGHHQGDLAIIETAALLRETFRDSDVIGRIGGDEFVVLALDCAEARVMQQRLEDCVARHNRHGERSFRLSLSVGIAPFHPAEPCSIDHLIECADGAMYAHKALKAPVVPVSRSMS